MNTWTLFLQHRLGSETICYPEVISKYVYRDMNELFVCLAGIKKLLLILTELRDLPQAPQ